MSGFCKRFTGNILSILALAGLFAATAPATADAGIFRMLLGGGGGGNVQNRDWTHVTSRQRVPFSSQYQPGTIVVSFADRRLYYIDKPGQALSYLIGTPVLEEKWQGVLKVSEKRVNPRWVPTADMRRKKPDLPLAVEGGDPRNPLGTRALYLGNTLYRIHGTDAPWTIGKEVSNGCVRLYNADILDLYSRVPVGTKVVVTYKRFPAAAAASQRGRRDRRASYQTR